MALAYGSVKASAQTIREIHLRAGATAYEATDGAGAAIDPAFGGFADRYVLTSGLSVSLADFVNPVSVAHTRCPPSRQLSLFLLGGSCKFSVDDGPAYRVLPQEALLCASSVVHASRVEADPDRRYRFVSIGFNDGWAAGLVSRPEATDDPLLRLLELGSRETFSGTIPMTKEVRRLADDYFTRTTVGACGALIAEARALQIIAGIAQEFQDRESRSLPAARAARLSRADIERLHEAKRLIDDEPETAFTVPVLARRVGINVNKLKVGFTLHFGQTVGRYATQVRMAYAHRLLSSGDIQVSSVAYRLGYNPTHFALAFRRWFGIAPSRVKR